MTAPLYGVLDLARAPHLYDHVERLAPMEAQCLFEGRLDPKVIRHCQHLVRLAPNDPLTRLWWTQGWGDNWGMVISSSSDLRTVRRRLRHFTQAKLPSGEGPVLFRFWDPRVFRVYMPEVEAPALADWFKHIDRYVVATEDGKGSIQYFLKDGALSVAEGPAPV